MDTPRTAPPPAQTPAVVALGVTQIVGYGTLYYAYAVMLPRIATDMGWSLSQAFGAFSIALFLGGFAAPLAGRTIDRKGGRVAMIAGSIGAALGLVALSQTTSLLTFCMAVIAVETAATFVLYDAAFPSLTQVTGPRRARRAITQLTLIAGFASTIFWPLTYWLTDHLTWREIFLLFAALHLLICLPLHALVLARPGQDLAKPLVPAPQDAPPYAPLAPHLRARAMVLLILAFSAGGYVVAAMTSLWVTALSELGLSAAAAVTAGMLIGPAQVAVRLLEMAAGDRFHPRLTAMISLSLMLVALLLVLGLGAGSGLVYAFAILFGMSNGLTSIVRGTLPLALFGPSGFATRLGWIALVRMAANASAPLSVAALIEGWGVRVALVGMIALAALSLAALVALPRQRPSPSHPQVAP